MRRISLAALFIAFLPLVSLAQTGGGATLVGTVRDSTGALVVAAKVRVVNTGTSFLSETVTSGEGSYYIPYLNPGSYRITVEAAGFRQYVRDGIALRSGETPRIDITLEVGALSEAITVTAAAALLNTETAGTSQSLGEDVLLTLANVQKRIVRTLYYMPGTIGTGQTGYHILGQRQRAIGFTLDGISGKTPGTGTFDQLTEVIQTTQDALEEIKVQTSGMSAEYGHSAGGAMNLVFKSGTNDLHGSIEDRHISTSMVHRHFLEQNRSTTPFRYDEVDGTLSGPVFLPKLYNGRNRTFFLFGYADHIESWAPESRTTVPSLEMLNGDFSFGGQGLPIYDPDSTRQPAPGRWERDPFPGNIVPKSRFDPVSVNFLSRNPWAKPNSPGFMSRTGPQQNLVANSPKPIRRTRWDVKLDHQFSASHKIYGRYSHAHHRAARAGYNPQFAWTDLDPNRQPIPTDNINLVFNDTFVFGPNRFNELRLGYNRRAYTLDALTYGQGWAAKLGIPGVNGETFPYFNVGYGLDTLSREYQIGEDIPFQNNFTQIAGTHTIKAGYELIRTRFNATRPTLPGGQYNFGATGFPFTPNTGNTFAAFLLGSVTSASFTQQMATWLPRWWMHSLYLQDKWKIRRGLTLSLGLRWSYESPFQTKYGQQAQFDPQAIDPLTGRKGAITHPRGPLAARDWNNFQPRLGLVWNLRPKWVFRSSFGIMTQDVGAVGMGQNFQEYNGVVSIQLPPGDPRSVFRLSQGPGEIRYPAQPDGTIPFVGDNYSGRGADWYDPSLRLPYVMNWSGGFQYEFAKSWLLEMMYQATAGVGLLNNWNINMIPLDISTDLKVLDQIYQAQQNYKPYPHFGGIQHYSNYGHNTHHSATLRLEKRHSSGLTIVSFYTFGKTLNEADGDGGAGGITYYNRRLEKGRAGYDVRHHSNFMVTYDFPWGKGRRWLNRPGWMDHVLGGWALTLNQTFDSGLPTTVDFGGSPNRYLSGNSRPVALVPIEQAVVQDWDIGPNRFPAASQNPYLRFDAFAYPAAYTPGTLGRNIFESPGLNWTQFALAKNWTLRERFKVTLRLDAHNLPFKKPQFARPAATYNRNNQSLFGTFNGTRGSWSEYGSSQPSTQICLRLQF